jgi:diaminopimelate epimerase
MALNKNTVAFHKMHGCGNDFIFIDNRSLGVSEKEMACWANAVCPQAFGVGADGLVFLESPSPGTEADYIWHFFNADGSRAEMCGNASRCAALLAVELGFAGEQHVLGTDAGPVRAVVTPGSDFVTVELPPPGEMRLNLALDVDGVEITTHFTTVGVPHAVSVWEDVASMDIMRFGPCLRFHSTFDPAGTNANFIQIKDQQNILLRTYERGVESETFACGTGAAASVLVAHALGLTGPDVHVKTSGGEVLRITLENGRALMGGKAIKVYDGVLHLDSVGLSQP